MKPKSYMKDGYAYYHNINRVYKLETPIKKVKKSKKKK
jgi:hypothetical protein